jgi:hypothetical protein
MLNGVKIWRVWRPIQDKWDGVLKKPSFDFACHVNRSIILHELIAWLQVLKNWA